MHVIALVTSTAGPLPGDLGWFSDGPLSVNWSSPGFHQPIWVIPTRHPGQLETALATLPLPAGTVGDPYAGASPDITVAEWSNP